MGQYKSWSAALLAAAFLAGCANSEERPTEQNSSASSRAAEQRHGHR